jgi:hypothetical protein
MFIYYSDADSTQWVETSPSGGFSDVAASFQTINIAFDTANAAYNKANTSVTDYSPAFNKANGAYTVANAAFNAANNAVTDFSPAFNKANAAYTNSNTAFDVANAAFNSANNVAPQVAPSFNTANAAYTLANLSYNATNSVFGVANAAFNSANNVAPQVAPAFNTANAAYTTANAGYTTTNAAFNTSNAAYNYANASNTWANVTFVKLTAGQQTITGDLAVTGNLTFLGNSTVISSAQLTVGDSLIYLAANNYSGTDLLDVGFIANYGNTTGANVHTGLVRDATDKQYYLFSGYDREPANNTFVPGGNNMVNAVLVADFNTSNLTLGGANAITWIKTSYDTANAAYTSSNGVNTYASATYSTLVQLGSNWTVTNAAFGVANAAYTYANNHSYYAGNNGDKGNATGLGDIFRVHSNTLSQNVTIYSGNNAVAVGPLNITGSSTTLTIQPGARVAIV